MRRPGLASAVLAVLAMGVLLAGHLHPALALLGGALVWLAVYSYLSR